MGNDNELFAGLQKSFEKKNNKTVKNKNESNTVLLEKEKEYNLFSNIKLYVIEYSNDKKINKFLAEKTLILKTVQANSSIVLGKTFQEVKNELGRKKDLDGLYVKWLEDNGYNKMTALRHRNRYNLFRICKSEDGKFTIATIPTKLIQNISKLKDGERADVLRKIDDGATREEIEDILGIDLIEDKNEPERDIVKKIEIYDFLDDSLFENIKNDEELKFCDSKLKEFEKMVKNGKEKLKDVKVRIHNENNKFKTVQ